MFVLDELFLGWKISTDKIGEGIQQQLVCQKASKGAQCSLCRFTPDPFVFRGASPLLSIVPDVNSLMIQHLQKVNHYTTVKRIISWLNEVRRSRCLTHLIKPLNKFSHFQLCTTPQMYLIFLVVCCSLEGLSFKFLYSVISGSKILLISLALCSCGNFRNSLLV